MKDPKVVGIDFDGVLVPKNYPMKPFSELDILPGAREGMAELKRQGWIIVIDSCRGDSKGIRDFLREKGVTFDYVGVNPYAPKGVNKGKLHVHVKLDDRVVTFRSWKNAVRQINENYEENGGAD